MNNSIGLLAATLAVFLLASPVAVSADDANEAADAVVQDDSATVQAERERTLEAEKAAANGAADRLRENTRLDLDIRLIGHNSKKGAATH